jgi:hypothetical protein
MKGTRQMNKVEQADAAWSRLVNDLSEVGGASEAAIERSKIAVRRGLPWAIGAAVVVFGVMGVKWMRRRRRRPIAYSLEQRRSLLSEMARTTLLSGVGAVAARVAGRVPMPRLAATCPPRQRDA